MDAEDANRSQSETSNHQRRFSMMPQQARKTIRRQLKRAHVEIESDDVLEKIIAAIDERWEAV